MKEKNRIEINKFNNFTDLSNPLAISFYNYLPTDKLYNSWGLETAKFPTTKESSTELELNIADLDIAKICGATYFKQYFADTGVIQHRILVYGDDKKVYINQLFDADPDLYWLYNLEFNSAPVTLVFKKDDADAIILTSTDKMVIWKTNYSPYTIEDVPIITSMCMNEGVLFCTIKEPAFKIWYATDLDAENVGNISSNSGYISLEDELGDARKIVAFNESVFVFRDYGISKINYVKNEATVSQVYLSNTKIFTNTVNVCGNVIIFMTKDGVYSFNGVKVTKTSVDIRDMLTDNNDSAVASSLGNNYMLALKLDFKDDKTVLCEEGSYVNNAIVIVDITDYSYQIIRGVDVQSLLPIKTEVFEKMIVTFNSGNVSKLGQITNNSSSFETPLPKYWVSGELNKDYNVKLFTKLTVKADIDVKFNLKYDDKNISFTTYKTGVNEFCFKICCKQIVLEISSSKAQAQVDNVILDYYEY